MTHLGSKRLKDRWSRNYTISLVEGLVYISLLDCPFGTICCGSGVRHPKLKASVGNDSWLGLVKLGTGQSEYFHFPLSIERGDTVLGAVSVDRLTEFSQLNLLHKVAQFEGLMLDGCFRTPTAVYKGLARPLELPGAPAWYSEERMVITVSKPKFGMEIRGRVPVRSSAPEMSVFVAYMVKIDDQGQRDRIRGALAASYPKVYLAIDWEWVFCDEVATDLPREYQTRYRGKVS